MEHTVLVFDPGEHTGWCCARNTDSTGDSWVLRGGTADKDHRRVVELLDIYMPAIVVLERFNLYPGMAKTLSWNSFYPCETIGVIKFICAEYSIPVVEQAPSVKKYFGGFQADWELVKQTEGFKLTEHVKDAYQHLKYFERNGLKHFESATR